MSLGLGWCSNPLLARHGDICGGCKLALGASTGGRFTCRCLGIMVLGCKCLTTHFPWPRYFIDPPEYHAGPDFLSMDIVQIQVSSHEGLRLAACRAVKVSARSECRVGDVNALVLVE